MAMPMPGKGDAVDESKTVDDASTHITDHTSLDDSDVDVITATPTVLHMLSTIDNPNNPFTHWDEWESFDTARGYYTSSFLARVARVSDEMSEADQDIQMEQAIIDIVNEDVLDMYIRVPAPIDI